MGSVRRSSSTRGVGMWSAVVLVVLTLCPLQCHARVRTFYIAAVEVDWNYAPLGNLVNDDTQTSDKYLQQGEARIGRVYRKILYREFTDSTFTRQAGSPPVLGMLGPTLRAETGDTLEVVFKNMAMTANRSLSVHPHGVQYDKRSEGALYVDHTTGTDKADDGVPPGATFTYVWHVSPSFAPTADDEPCLPWVYHSHVSSTRDVDSGLVGLLLTCKQGSLRRRGRNKGRRKDVSEEYPIYVDTTDENASWLLEHNLQHCRNHDHCRALSNARDQGFTDSNKMSHINGRSYGNLAGLEVARWGKPVVFYFFSVNRGMTGVHLSGQVFTIDRHIKDSVSVYPATFVSAYLTPTSLGHWLMASTNVDSYFGGQQAFVRVVRWTSFPWERKRRHAPAAAALMTGNSTLVQMANTNPVIQQALHALANGQGFLPPGVNLGQDLQNQIAGQGLQAILSRRLGQGQNQNQNPVQGVQDLLSGQGLQNAIANQNWQSVVSSGQEGLQSVLSNPGVQNLLSNQAVQDFISSQGLQDMLSVDGVQGLLSSLGLQGVLGSGSQPARISRRYFLAVEDVEWDYAPSQGDLFSGGPLNVSWPALFFTRGPHTIGGRYKKSRFVRYLDSTYTMRHTPTEAEKHMGIMGPLLMAEVGETVEVHVKNMASRPYSFFPRGVHFDKAHEGYLYKNPSTSRMEGRIVEPGDCKKYRFKIPALGRDDLPCITQTYHSAVNPPKDVHTGLFGPCYSVGVVSWAEILNWSPWYGQSPQDRPNGRQWFQTHQHFFLSVFTLDENLSWHLQDNINTYTTDPAGVASDFNFWVSNRRHGINGLMYANLEGLSSCRGDPVAWHLLGLGGDIDVHGVIFHGQTLEIQGNTVSAKIVSPGTAVTLVSTPDTVGNWSVACRSNMHLLAGMTAIHDVKECGRFQPQMDSGSGVTRRYYISAEEVLWDYAPLKRDLITGLNFTDDSQHGYLYVKDTDDFIGSVYKKVRYFAYTDGTFCHKQPRLPHHRHLGILGPVIQAEVGDTIQVVFYNNASRPYSIHPQGVQYDKQFEGAMYQDGHTSMPGKAVLPGHKFTYTWRVPERSGPGPNDPNCIAWMYYSSVNSAMDMSSGLVGPLLVCQPGTLTRTSPSAPGTTRFDVDREFWMLYHIFDENLSWYLMDNIRERAPARTNPRDPAFVESNLMNAINGLVFGNVQGMVMREGEVVSWYLLGLGSSNDFHPVHFHGQTFTQHWQRKHRGDVVEVFPSTSAAVEMLCDNPGTWIVHCHLANHVAAGMEATFTILPNTAP